MKKTIFVATLSLIFFVALGQLNYLGLKDKFGKQRHLGYSTDLNPECKLIDNYLYMPTYDGIWRKDLNQSDTNWTLYAFGGLEIKDFVKYDNKIVGITTNTKDSILVYSEDNGLTYRNYTSPHFFEQYHINFLRRIAQNKENPATILVLHEFSGVSVSYDYGLTWKSLTEFAGGNQDRFVEFHPLDTSTIYSTGEQGFYYSYINMTFDGGKNWTQVYESNNCVHFLAFHPSNPNIILSGEEGRISKSTDKGVSWTSIFLNDYLYISKLVFDKSDPNIVYAAGYFNTPKSDSIFIYKSMDCGNTWNRAFQQYLEDCGDIHDFIQYQNKLVLITRNLGLYTLDLTYLSIDTVPSGQGLELYPNPTKLNIYFPMSATNIEIINPIGQIIATHKTTEGNGFDLSNLENGLYITSFDYNGHRILRKIVKE